MIVMDFVLKENLQRLMEKNALNVPRLAKLTGISKQTISNWMAGQKPKNIQQVKTVANFFGISLDYLCFGEGQEKKTKIKDYEEEINAGIFEVVLRRVKK